MCVCVCVCVCVCKCLPPLTYFDESNAIMYARTNTPRFMIRKRFTDFLGEQLFHKLDVIFLIFKTRLQ